MHCFIKLRDYRGQAPILLPLMIVSACMLTSLSSAWAAETSKARPAADWLQVDYEPLKSLKAVPAAVLKALLLKMPYDPRLADQGEKFNVIDVVDSRIPMRRFAFGGKSSQCILICYEHGGRSHHYHLVVFAVGGETPQVVFAGRPGQRVQTINEVKELVRQGKLKNEIEEEHQEW